VYRFYQTSCCQRRKNTSRSAKNSMSLLPNLLAIKPLAPPDVSSYGRTDHQHTRPLALLQILYNHVAANVDQPSFKLNGGRHKLVKYALISFIKRMISFFECLLTMEDIVRYRQRGFARFCNHCYHSHHGAVFFMIVQISRWATNAVTFIQGEKLEKCCLLAATKGLV